MVIDFVLVGQQFDETFGVIGGPTFVHFAVGAKRCVHKIVLGFYAFQRKTVGMQGDIHLAGNIGLAVGQKRFHIPHHGIKVLTFVQVHSVEIGQVFLVLQLPFGERVLFEQMVRFDDDERCGGLKAHAALDAYNCIAHVNIAA